MQSTSALLKWKKLAGMLGVSLLVLLSACKKEGIKFDTTHPNTNNGPVQYETPFENVPATPDVIMYEVNPRVFSAAGNLKGVQARLDSIKALGINVVWLMPIYPIGELKGIGSPYAVRDYKLVNTDFGTLEDLRDLVREAHKRDMAVILDWVANHTSWDNAWIQNKAWYTQDASGNIVSPLTWNDVADLNYSNQAMRQEMIKAMKYWVLEANVDGYRCDYAEGVPGDFWKQAIDTLRNIPNRDIVMFAEAADKSLFNSGFDLTFGWTFYHKLEDVYNENKSVAELIAVNTADNSGVPAGKRILRWTSNHDDNATTGTPISIFKGKEGSMAAFVITSCMGGAPLLYNGQEVGCPTQLSFFKGGGTKIDWSINSDMTQEYKKILALRSSSDAIRNGSIEAYSGSSDVLAFKRKSAAEEVLVIANVRASAANYQLPSAIANSAWINALNGSSVQLNSTLSLAPFSYLILKK